MNKTYDNAKILWMDKQAKGIYNKNNETFCSLTHRPTGKVNYMLNFNWYGETSQKFQPSILNRSREIRV